MKKVSVCLLFCLALIPSWTMAQTSRSYIREQIREWGECKNVAITQYNGDLALYGRNGWAGQGLPKGFSRALNELNENNELIDDVVLTEEGSWIIQYGNNGFRYAGISSSLESKIEEYNERGDVIMAVTYCDSGRWILISDKYYVSSAQWIQDWLNEGSEKFGELWTACVTDDAMVAVYDRGYKFYGDVPDDLRQALLESELDVYRLKISGSAWFFADKQGNYRYNM